MTKNEKIFLWLVMAAAIIAAVAIPQSRRIFILMAVVILSASAAFKTAKEEAGNFDSKMSIWNNIKHIFGNIIFGLILGYVCWYIVLFPIYWFAYPKCPAHVTDLLPTNPDTQQYASDEVISDVLNTGGNYCPNGKVLMSLQIIIMGVWVLAFIRPVWQKKHDQDVNRT